MYSISFDLWICQLLIKVSMIFITCTSRPQWRRAQTQAREKWQAGGRRGCGWHGYRCLTYRVSSCSLFTIGECFPRAVLIKELKSILYWNWSSPYLICICFVLSWFSLEVLKIYIYKSMWTWLYTTYRAVCCFWFVTFFPCSTVLQFFFINTMRH